MSVVQNVNSPRKMIVHNPWSDTMPEYTFFTSTTVRWPSATILTLCQTIMMFNIKYKMHVHLLELWWWTCLIAEVHESVIFLKLLNFQINGVLPWPLTFLLVEVHCLIVVLWDLITIFVSGTLSRTTVILLGLPFKQASADILGCVWGISIHHQGEKIVVRGIFGANDWVISCYDGQKFSCSLSILPLNQDVVARTVVVLSWCNRGPWCAIMQQNFQSLVSPSHPQASKESDCKRKSPYTHHHWQNSRTICDLHPFQVLPHVCLARHSTRHAQKCWLSSHFGRRTVHLTISIRSIVKLVNPPHEPKDWKIQEKSEWQTWWESQHSEDQDRGSDSLDQV